MFRCKRELKNRSVGVEAVYFIQLFSGFGFFGGFCTFSMIVSKASKEITFALSPSVEEVFIDVSCRLFTYLSN